MSATDRLHAAPIHQREIQGFVDCIEDLGLGHTNKTGCDYSWCNKREANERLYSRIDWILGNPSWFMQYGQLEVVYGNPDS